MNWTTGCEWNVKSSRLRMKRPWVGARLPEENPGVFKQYFDSYDCSGFTSQGQCTSVTERWSFASAISCSPIFNWLS
jgi:hypothetical protein